MTDPLNIPELRASRAGMDPRALRAPSPPPSAAPDRSFNDTLMESIGEVQRLQNEADTTIRKLVAGEIKDVTDVVVAVEKADVAFQTMMVVRNKMMQAYEEVMRMQV